MLKCALNRQSPVPKAFVPKPPLVHISEIRFYLDVTRQTSFGRLTSLVSVAKGKIKLHSSDLKHLPKRNNVDISLFSIKMLHLPHLFLACVCL